jgi:gamma-glutamyltranspeptidase
LRCINPAAGAHRVIENAEMPTPPIAFAERSATTAPPGMVTCPHALASQAGVDVLKAGGSAVDAAIAAGSTLAVIYPHMTGLGGDAFWLIFWTAA